MITNLEESILKELDRQNIKGNLISIIMKKLDTFDKKNEFLSFMVDNRNILLNVNDMFKIINEMEVTC